MKLDRLLNYLPSILDETMTKLLQGLYIHVQKNNTTFFYLSFAIIISSVLHFAFMSNGCLLVEEAYYWNYSQHLDWSYLDHPPMVAILIKLFTTLLGTSEFGVRGASLFCWLISTFYSYKLCELIQPESGRYAILLLVTLPFFFIQSIVITPDVPLITCWSSCLYYLYKALVLRKKESWYWAGAWLGLGMLSKYTICLVALAAFCYVVSQASERFWFKHKEPYIATLIAALLFSPVIYWNANHEWVSFIFQSSRRINSITSLNLHKLSWMVLFFVTPLGVLSLWELARKNKLCVTTQQNAKRFLQYFTFVPLIFFALYSLNHAVNLNWPGPLFLALIPWISLTMGHHPFKKVLWVGMSLFLLILYSSILLLMNYNKSELIQQKLFIKVIAWDDLIERFSAIAKYQEQKSHMPVVFVPLDSYPISSELAFYQKKLLKEEIINRIYPTMGAHIFNRESLMYRYWSKNKDLSKMQLILLSKEAWRFIDPQVTKNIIAHSKLEKIWSIGQGQNIKNTPFYYQIVQLKDQNQEY